MTTRTTAAELEPQSEQPLNLIGDLVTVFDAFKAKLTVPDYDFKQVDSTFPDPHDFKKSPIELLEIYLQLAIGEAAELRKTGSGGILAAMKAERGIIEQADILLKELQNKEEQKKLTEESEEREALDEVLQALRIPLSSETAKEVKNLNDKIVILYGIMAQIGTSITDPRDVLLPNKWVRILLSDSTTNSTNIDILTLVQSIHAKSVAIRAQLTRPRDNDPVAYDRAMEQFNFAMVDAPAALAEKLQGILDKKLAKAEAAVIKKREQADLNPEKLEVSKIFNLSSSQQINSIRRELGLSSIYFGKNEYKITQNQTQLDVEAAELAKDRPRVLTIISRIEVTVAPIKEDLKKDIDERKSLFASIKQKLISKGELKKIEEDEEFSDENIVILRKIFENDNQVLAEIQKAQALSLLISKRTILIDSFDTILQWVYKIRGETKTESSEDIQEVVRIIYDSLKNNYVPANQEWRLPDFESLFKKKPEEVLEFLTVALIQRIEKFFDAELAAGETAFAFAGGSLDIWSNDKMFNVPKDGAHELGTFQFFIESFPWERLLSKENSSSENVVEFRKYVIDLWKYRILAIQNSLNAASGVEKLWRGNEHGSYKDDIFKHIASKGSGGGNQGWDQGPYCHITHRGKAENGSKDGEFLFAETFGVEEKSWQTPQYETFFIYQIEQFFNDFNYNNVESHKKLKEALSTDGFIYKKLVKMIEDQCGNTPQGRAAAERILSRDNGIINLAKMKAVWTIVHSLKLHEFDEGAIHVKLSRFMVKTYYRKVFATAVSGVRWRPNMAAQVEKAFMPMETFTRLSIFLTDTDGNDIFTKVNLNFATRDAIYGRWLLDLKLKSVDAFTAIFAEEDYDSTKSEDKKKVGLVQRRDALQQEIAQYHLTPNKIVDLQRETADLMIKVVKLKNYQTVKSKLTPSGQEERSKDLSRLRDLQDILLKHERFTELQQLTALIKSSLDSLPPGYSQDARNDVVMRTAADYAINNRYMVVKIKPEHTCLKVDSERLPIAIPIQRIRRNKDGRLVATQTPIQDIRNCQLSMSNDFVDFSSFPKNNNQNFVGYSGEAKRWYEMAELNDEKAIFASIHSKDVQDKAIAIPPTFSQELFDGRSWLIKRAINILNIKKGFASNDDLEAERPRRKILSTVKEFFSRKKKEENPDTAESTAAIGAILDEHLRQLIEVATIPEYELVSESDESKKEANPAGLGFPDVVQYAAKYLIGKSPDVLILLEMFREKSQNIEATIKLYSKTTDAESVKSFGDAIKTPVPDYLRRAIDQQLQGDAEILRVGEMYNSGPSSAEFKRIKRVISSIEDQIDELGSRIEDEDDPQLRRGIEASIKDLEEQIVKQKESQVYANYELDVRFAKTKKKRAENEIIVGLFWAAVDAYLDQYAFDIDLSDQMALETNYGRRETLMNKLDTISGAKPMNFVDRQIFVHYVDAMIKYFGSEKFAVGNERPTNLCSSADVFEMMKRKGIIGSTQQILVDLHYFEGSGYKELVKKSSDTKKS